MQNKYVGDVGDFANNGLLRWLTGITVRDNYPRLSLGIVSYLNHSSPQFGGLNVYPNELADCDYELHTTLQTMIEQGNRTVFADGYKLLMPPGTRFFNDCRGSYKNRTEWLLSAIRRVERGKPELTFLNPDVGILLDPYEGTNDSPEHAYVSDMRPFVERGHSLVVYQHQDRNIHGRDHIAAIRELLLGEFGPHECVFYTLWFHRIQARYYFLVAQAQHADLIRGRLAAFLASDWCQGDDPHFTFHDEQGNMLLNI